MKTISPEMQIFMDYLEHKKLKLTHHRELILENFLANEGHRSVEDLSALVRRHGGSGAHPFASASCGQA